MYIPHASTSSQKPDVTKLATKSFMELSSEELKLLMNEAPEIYAEKAKEVDTPPTPTPDPNKPEEKPPAPSRYVFENGMRVDQESQAIKYENGIPA